MVFCSFFFARKRAQYSKTAEIVQTEVQENLNFGVPLLAMLCWFALDSSREKDHVGVCHDKRKWMIVQLCKCVKVEFANDIG